MKLQKIIYPVINAVIRGLLILILMGMCLQSMFSTSFVGRIVREDGTSQERTLNIADQPWKHLLVFAVFTVVCILLCRGYAIWSAHREDCEKTGRKTGLNQAAVKDCTVKYSKVFCVLSIMVFVMGTLWILMTQLQPGSDPAKVYRIAMQWRAGDFSSYAEGGYLFRYPFQSGIILFYYFLSFLVGTENYVGLQLANVAALTVIYLLLAKLAGTFWKKDKTIGVIVYAALILWTPLAFYVTYLYGILPGMALSLGAVYCAAKYLDTRKYRYILPGVLCMGLATVIKMNCLIYLIAIACFLLYDAIDIALLTKKELGKKWIVSLAFIALMALSVAGCNKAANHYVERLSGYEAGDGEAMVSWVVMGLQETPLGPGGYSGYIWEVFERYHYDTEQIKEASIADIKAIIKRMAENPLDEGIPFFARKNAFQWNDPTFISLDRTKGRTSAVDMPEFAQSLIDGKGSVAFYIVMNYAQTLIWLGVILYLLFHWGSKNLYELMGAVVFLGGFLFHFMWESSASYTIPYFVVVLPYGVKGLADWVRFADGAAAAVKENGIGKAFSGEWIKGAYKPAAGILAVLFLVALFSRTNLFDRTIALNDGEEAAEQFYHRGAWEDEKASGNSYCYLSPYLAQDSVLLARDNEVTVVSGILPVQDGLNDSAGTGEADIVTNMSQIKDIERKILVKKDGSQVRLRFRSNEQALAVDRSGEDWRLITYLDDGMNMFYESAEDVTYRWKMSPAEGEGFYISADGMALTYRDGELTLEELTKDDTQRWVMQDKSLIFP